MSTLACFGIACVLGFLCLLSPGILAPVILFVLPAAAVIKFLSKP